MHPLLDIISGILLCARSTRVHQDHPVVVHSDGRIWVLPYNSTRAGAVRPRKCGGFFAAPSRDRRQPYWQVSVPAGRRPRGTRMVHVLVCEAFHGPRPEGMVAMHKNDYAEDNRPDNLRWGTQAENVGMAVIDRALGADAGGAKLSADDVANIRAQHAAGRLQRELAEQYGVNQPHISRIVRGVSWARSCPRAEVS